NIIATASLDETVRIWDANTGKELGRFRGHAGGCVAFSPDGNWLISGEQLDNRLPRRCAIRLWHVKTQKLIRTFYGHTGSIISVAFSSDGKRLVSSGNDATARVWDVATGEEALLIRAPERIVRIVLSPDDQRLIAGLQDGTVRIWDAT